MSTESTEKKLINVYGDFHAKTPSRQEITIKFFDLFAPWRLGVKLFGFGRDEQSHERFA